MSDNNKKLCLALLNADSEQDVINILKYWGYWNKDSAWRYFGDNENNWSQIGNQQGHPVAAMVEKLVNSIDAVLMRECQVRGISLEGENAPTPKSIIKAQEKFFGIKNGNLAKLGSPRRTELAKHIGLIATGARGRSKINPTYTVFDRGEGQTPQDMPDTLLSLSKSNKLRIPFVQGKFNMGGTGVLRHGGKHRLQLIVSRRCPQIADQSDPTSNHWGFTIVRRQVPPKGSRSSVFTYLAPNCEVLMFDSEVLRMPHGVEEVSHAPELQWGTAIKLYEYNMKGYRANIKLDLYYALSTKLPQPGLPIRFYEYRVKNVQGSPEATMAGLLVRLEDDRGKNLEKNFPRSYTFVVSGEKLKVVIYAFKKDADDSRFRKSDGIVFTINGQAHGSLPKRFFSRQKVKMDYIKDSIFVIVDATDISASAREDLFMNSRDRLSEGDLRGEIEDELERIIKNDPLLKALREQRRREAIANKLADAEPLKEVLDVILKKSPALEALFITGKDLSNPYKSVAARIVKEQFKGKDYPTYFRLLKKHQRTNNRPINRRRIRVQFETDAENTYFDRETSPGSHELDSNGSPARDHNFHLLDGLATLNITLPDDIQVGNRLSFASTVNDETRIEPFVNEFEVIITDPVTESKGRGGKRQPPTEEGLGDRNMPDSVALPKIYEVREEEWEKYDFNQETALQVKNSGDDSYDYYINMDNIYLNTELKSLKRSEDPKLLQAKFKYAMALLGMMILKDTTNIEDEAAMLPTDMVAKVTSMISPVILPMIEHLGDLDIDSP